MKSKWKGALIGGVVGLIIFLGLVFITKDKPEVGFVFHIILIFGIFVFLLSIFIGMLIGMKKFKLLLIVLGLLFIPSIISRIFFGKDITISIFVSIILIVLFMVVIKFFPDIKKI